MPGVSLVATVLDEGAAVEPWLDRLFAQTRPPDEVVVVDGGSGPDTLAALERAAARHPGLAVHHRPGANIAAGRNAAIALARGPVIAVTDAGTTAEPEWLERLVAPFADPSVGVSAGFFLPGGTTAFERLLSVVITPQIEEIDPAAVLPSSRSVAFTKAAWAQAGGYPEWLSHCEDLVFDLELRRRGVRFAFVPDARVRWATRASVPAFMRQYFAYARGDGHAQLWPRRHAARYAAYAGGLVLLRRRHHALLAAGFVTYQRKFWRRLRRRPPFDGVAATAAAHALAPALVVCGDVAKMAGYPVGVAERRRGVVRP